MAIDRLPSGRFRVRLMIDEQRYTATLPTGAARCWAGMGAAMTSPRGSIANKCYVRRYYRQQQYEGLVSCHSIGMSLRCVRSSTGVRNVRPSG